MAEELDAPNTGDIGGGHHEDATNDSVNNNEYSDNGSGISPGQSPRGGPTSFGFTPTRQHKALSGNSKSPEGTVIQQPQADGSYQTASMPALSAYQDHEISKAEGEELLDFEHDVDDGEEDKPRAPRPDRGRANTYTFDAPTKSSMAKQNDKVKFPPTLRRKSTMNRTISSRTGSAQSQQSLVSEDFEGPFHFNSPISVNTPRVEWANVQRQALSGDENSRDVLVPEVPLVDLQHDAQNRNSTQEQHRFESMASSSDMASRNYSMNTLAADTVNGGHNTGVRKSSDDDNVVPSREQFVDVTRLPQQYVKAAQDNHGYLAECLRDVQDQRDEPLPGSQILLENHEQPQQESNVLRQRSKTYYLHTGLPDTLEEALEEIILFREVGMDVKKAEKDSENANAVTAQIYDDYKKLRDDLQILEGCVKDKFAAVLEGATEYGLIRSSKPLEDFAPVVKEHAGSLFELFTTFDEALDTLKETNSQVQEKLLKEKRLSKYLDEKKRSTDSERLLAFQKQYEEEKKKREIVEDEFQKFREVASGSMDSEFKIENAKLKDSLSRYHKRTIIPRLQASIYQAKARLWKEEARVAKEELTKRTRAFEVELKGQKLETLQYIRDYYEKTKDASHWNLQDLQAKVASLEHELNQTNDFFSRTKTDKARLEDKVGQQQVEITKLKEYIKETLLCGGNDLSLPSSVPDLDPDSSSDASGSSSPISWLVTPDPSRPKLRYPPRFLLKQEKYMAEMQRVRKEQEKRRLQEDALDKLMEKLRKYRMGVMGVKYPPTKGAGWETMEKKMTWDRWDGEGWRREVKLTRQEEELLENLKRER
ncbi:hypothetical protein J1614_009273 [Plenodomus biglobosus]|nr:hypothetical protein J1614_009273 [Plenodomus biglobosus]